MPFDPHMLECILCPGKFPSVALLKAHSMQRHANYMTEEFLLPSAEPTEAEMADRDSGSVASSPFTPEEQRLLLENRERSLLFWKHIAGQQLDLTLYEKTCVKATLLACDAKQSRLLVADLESPMGVYPKAVLRGSDIVKLECWPFGKPPSSND